MEKELFRASLQEAAAAYGLMLTTEQLAQFTRYYELLIAWNEKMNLTALTAPQEVAVKHMIDSLTAYRPEFFPAGT
jgi:16S rRNA (guanine527-N7)-methyltransferase